MLDSSDETPMCQYFILQAQFDTVYHKFQNVIVLAIMENHVCSDHIVHERLNVGKSHTFMHRDP